MSKYPINLIEADFIQKRLRFEDLQEKYGISMPTLAYHSKKRDWMGKRKIFNRQVIQKTMTAGFNQEVKEQKSLIERLEYLRDLKLGVEAKVFNSKAIQANKATSKEVMHLINKSKDPVEKLTKIIELLKGNATDRVEIDQKEKTIRYNRLREQMVGN